MTFYHQDWIAQEINRNVKTKMDVVTQSAKEAKKEYDQIKNSLDQLPDDEDEIETTQALIRDFQKFFKSVQRSHFMELVDILSQPTYMFLMHLMNGFFKGIGFMLGILLILFCFLMWSDQSVLMWLQSLIY